MLIEMDSFSGNDGLIVIAANKSPEILDLALTNQGSFDRQELVSLPDVKGRQQMLKLHMLKCLLRKMIEAMTVARGTPRYSGTDLANLVDKAALLAA